MKAQAYLRRALTDGERKSMEPMADRIGADQQIQQFVSSSTCPVKRAGAGQQLAQLADGGDHPSQTPGHHRHGPH
ncbi:transposase [Fodinicola feengrottensis]|uniref:transposase n=1 Tax=Fodinicola feengrottensis TaxID=435914 RepID=UPI003CD0B041